MNVLQLGKFYPVKGGVEKVMYDLASGLSEKGIRCDMLCASGKGEQGHKKINENSDLWYTKTWMKVAATTISPSMIFKLRKMCNKYDIVHIHHPDPMSALALWLSGYKGKVILHWHSDILKQKQLLKLYKPLQDWLLQRSALILGTSPVYVQESPFLADVQEKIDALPIGVNSMARTNDEEKNILALRQKYEGKKIVFSMGRLVGYKGYKYLIDAATYLPDDYVILIGGEGPLKEELQEQIDRKGLGEKVKLIGFVKDDELYTYFGGCDLFCLSSTQRTEAFAIVQVEAMSCGKPVVATQIPGSGVPWVNEDGVSGINVPIEDSSAIAEAIQNICSEKSVYQSYGEHALERYKKLFTKDDMLEKCIDFYKHLLNE